MLPLLIAALACVAPGSAVADWEPSAPLDPTGPVAGPAPNYDVGVGQNGLATALYFRQASEQPFLARRGADAPAWSLAPGTRAPGAAGNPFSAELAAGAAGDAVGIWDTGDGKRVEAAAWPASAETPRPADNVEANGDQISSHIAVDDAGNGYLVTADPSASPPVVRFRRFDAVSATWSAPVDIPNARDPRIAVNGRGDVVIAYRPASGANGVFARHKFADRESFSDEVLLQAADGWNSHAVTIDDAGVTTAVIASYVRPDPSPRAWAVRWPPGDPPTAPELLSSARPAYHPVSDVRVAQDRQGHVTASWLEQEPTVSGYRIYSAERTGPEGFRYLQPVTPSNEHVTDDSSSQPPDDPSPEKGRLATFVYDLAVDADGTATIVYTDSADGGVGLVDLDVKATRRATGGIWTPPVSLRAAGPDAGAVQNNAPVRIAAARAGQVDVLFEQKDALGQPRLMATRFQGPPPGGGEHQTAVRSFDGTPLLVQWCPAKGLEAGARAPTIIAGSGWGNMGRRCSSESGENPEEDVEGVFSTTSVEALTGAGYNVLTFDARGFWRSGGTAEIDSPDVEARDMQELIDYAATQPQAQLDAPGDPRLGMAGGSYGGGIQLVTAALDQRVDAIAPAIAWNSLVTSLFPRETVKASWAAILVGAGVPTTTLPGVLSPAGIEGGNMAPEIYEATAQGAAAGTIDAEKRAWFAARGPDFLLDRIEAPTLLIQGTVDTLFTLDEAHRNFEALEAAGTEVKMVWFCGGHGACERHGADQGHVDERVLAWFDRHLRRREVSTGPVFEWVDEDGGWHESASYPPAHNDVLEGTGKATLSLAPGEMPGSGAVIFATPYTYGSDHPAAIEVPIEVPPPNTPVIGPPQLRATYTATGTSTYGTGVEGAAQNRTYVYAQIVDNSRQRVVGNQATPIPITLDGEEHELALPLERIASSSSRAGYSLQIVPQTSVYDGQRAAGQVTFRSIDIKLPINGPGDLVPPVGGATAGGGGTTVAPPGSTTGRSRVWKCEGLAATITGTPRSDVISGTPGRDVIVALGGSDTIRARGGRDVICAGSGSDRVFAGAGNDHAFGNAGRDVVRGDSGSDRLLGQRGHDLLRGGLGNDRLLGGFGNDRLLGGAGSDVLRGERDRDILTGGAGDDRLSGAKGSDRLSGGAGNDLLRGERGRDTLTGGAGRDGLFGGAGNDVLRGHRRSDLLRGGSGTDRILTAG